MNFRKSLSMAIATTILTIGLSGCWHRHHDDDRHPPPPPPGEHHDHDGDHHDHP